MQKTDPVKRGAAQGWKPPTTLKPWQWAAENVKISNSERSSKFDPEQTPWWKAPMECAGDSDTREVVIVAPTGSGKSTMAEALIPYIIAEDPGAMLYASQTDEDAKFWAETRLKPALNSVEQVKDLWPEDRHKSRKTEIIFPHMPLILGGANLSNFQEKSVRWIYGDEVWAWKAGLLRECQARTHSRWNRKEFYVSQAGFGGNEETTGEYHGGDDLWREWMKTDRGEFSWKCSCGEAQPYDFEWLKYDVVERESGVVDEQETAKTARMECRACRKGYEDSVTNRRALSVSNMVNGAMGYIPTNPHSLDSMRGFHIDSMAVWWIPWKQEVLEFLEAKRLAKTGVIDRLRQFTQKRRAKFWTEDMADSQVLLSRSAEFSKVDYESGQKVEGEAHRFATIDAGGDHYWIVIAAWRQGGFMRVLYEGYIPSDGGDEIQLRDLCDGYKVPRHATLIDFGYKPEEMAELAVKHGWIGVRGGGEKRSFLHSTPNGKPVEKLYSIIKRTNAKSGGVATYMFFASNPVKDILARMLENGDQVELPGDTSKPFENHMKCERRTMEKNPKTGEEKSVWIRPGNKANHLWDCMYYQVGAALVVDLFDDLADRE